MSAGGATLGLDGQVALITGASSGLGRGCALELGTAGARLLCVGRRREPLDALVEELGAIGVSAEAFVADLTDDAAVEAAVRRAAGLGELRVAVNAAGISIPGAASSYSLADWDAQFAVNVRATFAVSKAVGVELIAAGRPGSIVNFSSILGKIAPAGDPAYAATKHAVEGLTKALAVEWGSHRIRVNAVAPGFVETPLTTGLLADPAILELVLGRTPIGRLIEVEEVARAVGYLASDASAGMTGHVLRVDGGWTVG
jgi:NAD(P)-dependent dehydrogenase (short-subunit alcohol dehydrogenase family)